MKIIFLFFMCGFFLKAEHEKIEGDKISFQEPEEWGLSSTSYDSVNTISSDEFDGWIISLRKIDYSTVQRPRASEKSQEELKIETNYDDLQPKRFVLTSSLKTQTTYTESLLTAQLDNNDTRVRYLVIGERPTEGEILLYPFFKDELDVQKPLTLEELKQLGCGLINGTIVSDKFSYKISPPSTIKTGGNSFWKGFTEVNIDSDN